MIWRLAIHIFAFRGMCPTPRESRMRDGASGGQIELFAFSFIFLHDFIPWYALILRWQTKPIISSATLKVSQRCLVCAARPDVSGCRRAFPHRRLSPLHLNFFPARRYNFRNEILTIGQSRHMKIHFGDIFCSRPSNRAALAVTASAAEWGRRGEKDELMTSD